MHRLTQQDFVLVTNDLTEVIMTGLLHACAKVGVDPSPVTLLEQTCTTVRQAWIAHERGIIRLGPEPPAPAPPQKAKDRYHDDILKQTDIPTLMRLMNTIGGASDLDGTEKSELADIAAERFKTLQAASA